MDVVRVAQVRESALSVDELIGAVGDPSAGALCVFVGVVRDHDHGRDVQALAYSAHPSAQEQLRQVCEQVAGHHDVVAVGATHRVGDLVVGDLAVVVAVSSRHRAEAFAAGQELIDTLKSTVPIWKHQAFGDGSHEWVGLP